MTGKRLVLEMFARKDINGSERRRSFNSELERDLTSTLAFLADISNDRKNVLAVWIKEYAYLSGIRILLAINKVKPSDG